MFNNSFHILALVVILIILLMNKKDNQAEGFIPEYELPIDNNRILGFDPWRQPEYRKRQNYYPRGYDRKDIKAHKWETRFPSLVDQRYKYNDERDDSLSELSPVTGRARLKELPLDLKNRWHAKIDKDIARTNLAYWPTPKHLLDDTDSKCNLSKTWNNPYHNRNVKNMNRINRNQLIPLSGHDPNDLLPANYADRSKTSIEIKQAEDLYKERMPEVHGWLPWEE